MELDASFKKIELDGIIVLFQNGTHRGIVCPQIIRNYRIIQSLLIISNIRTIKYINIQEYTRKHRFLINYVIILFHNSHDLNSMTFYKTFSN